MAVPRPVLLALLGVALCAAAFMATRGAREPAGTVTAIPAPVAAAPAAKPAGPANAAKQHGAHAAPKAGSTAAYAAAARHAADEAAKSAGTSPAAKSQRAHHGAQRAAGTRSAGRPAARQPAVNASGPAVATRVKQALAQGNVVVFFFTRAGAADDTATRGAVRALHGMRRVMVVKAGLEDLTTYSPVLSGAGVSQVPSVVVVRAHEKARLLEGYVDPGTLRQNVADALR